MIQSPRTRRRSSQLLGALAVVGLGLLLTPTVAGATDASLTVMVTATGGSVDALVDVICETPAPTPTGGVELAGAADATRYSLTVPADSMKTFSINDRTDGTACSVSAAGTTAVDLADVNGGTRLVGSDGRVRGVAVAVARGTTVTAHLDYQVPTAAASPIPSATDSTATTAVGSGSAVSPPLLPANDATASAAVPVALAAARSTTTVSSAALPDTSGAATVLVLASIGVALCGIVAYSMLLASRRNRGQGPTPT